MHSRYDNHSHKMLHFLVNISSVLVGDWVSVTLDFTVVVVFSVFMCRVPLACGWWSPVVVWTFLATLDFPPCTAPCAHTPTPTACNTVTGLSRAFRGIAERKRRKREQEATALMERYCLMPCVLCHSPSLNTCRMRQWRGGVCVLCCPVLV